MDPSFGSGRASIWPYCFSTPKILRLIDAMVHFKYTYTALRTHPILIVRSPQTIAKHPTLIDKAKAYNLGADWVGKGLLIDGGDSWRMKRKLLAPAFNFKVLSKFAQPIDECCTILVGRSKAIADGRPVEIQENPALFSMDVICGK